VRLIKACYGKGTLASQCTMVFELTLSLVFPVMPYMAGNVYFRGGWDWSRNNVNHRFNSLHILKNSKKLCKE